MFSVECAAKLHGDDGGPEFKALCEQIHDLKCRQKESRSSMRQMQNREYGRFSQALAVLQKDIADDLLRIAVEHGVGKSQGAWLAKALFNAMRKNAKADLDSVLTTATRRATICISVVYALIGEANA